MMQTSNRPQVGAATDESMCATLHMGFVEFAVEAPKVACPSCRQRVPHPGFVRDGSLALAECVPCDIYFPAVWELTEDVAP
jgi:hypothetical protein